LQAARDTSIASILPFLDILLLFYLPCRPLSRLSNAKASFITLDSGGGHHHYDGEQEELRDREIQDENVLSLKMKPPQCENEAEMKLTPHYV